jgi:phosphotransferase system  glucose/maltose/N-acetylglucosamine-specific IIC component
MTAKAAQKISLWEFFQQLGKTFMLPVALLSFCGIMLGIGSSLSSKDVIPDPVPRYPRTAGDLHLETIKSFNEVA